MLSPDTKSIGLFAMCAVVAPGAVAAMTRALTSDRPRMSNSSTYRPISTYYSKLLDALYYFHCIPVRT